MRHLKLPEKNVSMHLLQSIDQNSKSILFIRIKILFTFIPSYFEIALNGLKDLNVRKTFKNPRLCDPALLKVNAKLITETLKCFYFL